MINFRNANSATIVMLLMFCLPLFAQDGSSTATTSTPKEVKTQTVETQSANTESSNSSNNESEDQVFIPSEEISEDAPVAFPVDI